MARVLPIYKWGLVMKFMHHVTDMECECFCESETELLECSVFRSLYERELMGNFGLFLKFSRCVSREEELIVFAPSQTRLH